MPSRKKKGKKERWRHSEAKKLLKKNIINKKIPPTMKAREVYEMEEEYKKWPYKNFPTNLKNLRAAIKKDYDRAKEDLEAYKKDRETLKKLRANDPPQLLWHKSEACGLLKQDIYDGKHKLMKPRDLYLSRKEYQLFDLETFRNQIYNRLSTLEKRKSRYEKKKIRASFKKTFSD